MNILLASISYPPEIRSISIMVRELADALTSRGHKITVVTPYPKYNIRVDAVRKKFDLVTIENDVRVIRAKTLPHHQVNYIVRGIGELTLPYLLLWKLKKVIAENVDAVVVYTSPLPMAFLGIKIKRLYGARFLLNIQDIFPQNAIDLGILKNKALIKIFEWMEDKAYRAADKITAHSQSNMNFLITEKGVPPQKISTLHNWIDLKPYRSLERTGKFRKKYGLEDKFIFVFGGVMGPSQNLALIIRAAQVVSNVKDICFLLLGDGTEKERLQRMVADFGLENVIFKSFVSQEDYPLLVKDADVGLACLSHKNKTPVYPGKIIGFMAARIPVIAFLNPESDGHELIKQAVCGYSSISDDYKKAAELIIKFYNEKDLLKKLGNNGFEYVASHFSKETCIDKMESHLI